MKDELPKGLGIEGIWSPVAIISEPGEGKSTLLGEFIYSELERDFIILEGDEEQYKKTLEWSKSIKHRTGKIFVYRYDEFDKFMETAEKTKNACLVLEDLTEKIHWSRERKLRAYLLNKARKLGQSFILITHGLSKKLLLGIDFGYYILGRCFSYRVKILGDIFERRSIGRRLKEDILNKLRHHEFIGVDVSGRSYSFLNEGSVEALSKMIKGKWKGAKTIPERKAPERKKLIYNNKNSKKDKAKELMLEGFEDADIIKKLGVSYNQLCVWRSQLYREDEEFRKRYLEIKAKKGVRIGRPVAVENSGVNSKGIILFSKEKSRARKKVRA
jgi:hypothetical protein